MNFKIKEIFSILLNYKKQKILTSRNQLTLEDPSSEF